MRPAEKLIPRSYHPLDYDASKLESVLAKQCCPPPPLLHELLLPSQILQLIIISNLGNDKPLIVEHSIGFFYPLQLIDFFETSTKSGKNRMFNCQSDNAILMSFNAILMSFNTILTSQYNF